MPKKNSACQVLNQAYAKYGQPEIVNVDQGTQFTDSDFTAAVLAKCELSMDGKGAWRDNVFIERFWRSVKYERVYLMAYDTPAWMIRRHRTFVTTGSK